MTEWIKREDGELYPAKAEDELTIGYLIGTYRAETEEIQSPKIKIRQDNTLLNIPNTTLQTMTEIDPRLNMHMSRFTAYITSLVIEDPANLILTGIAVFLGFGIFTAAAMNMNKTFTEATFLLYELLAGGTVGTLIYSTIVKMIRVIGRRCYRINKETYYYTFKMATKSIVPVKVIGLYEPATDFMSTSFLCEIENNTFAIKGHNLFMSELEAKQVMDFVSDINDYEISKYYPEWKNDSMFIKWFQDRIKHQGSAGYGFGYETTTDVILSPKIYINGLKFKGGLSAIRILKEYLKHLEYNKEKEKYKQDFLQEINSYRQNNQKFSDLPLILRKELYDQIIKNSPLGN